MKKYKIGNKIITADSAVKALSIYKALDSKIKDKYWFDLQPGDIIKTDRLNKNAKYKVLEIKGEHDFAVVERIETADFKRKDDPYAFRPTMIALDNRTQVVDSIKDNKFRKSEVEAAIKALGYTVKRWYSTATDVVAIIAEDVFINEDYKTFNKKIKSLSKYAKNVYADDNEIVFNYHNIEDSIKDTRYVIMHPRRNDYLSVFGTWVTEDSDFIIDFENKEKALQHGRKYADTEFRIAVKDSELDTLTQEEQQAIDNYKNAIANTSNLQLLSLYQHILEEEIEHHKELQNAKTKEYVKDTTDPVVVEFKGNNHLVSKLKLLAKDYPLYKIRPILEQEADFNPKMSNEQLKVAARELGINLK